MRKILLPMLAVAVLLGFAYPSVVLGEMKPVATVSFAGYDKLMTDIGVFGRLGGNPDMATGMEFMLQMVTQGKGLNGLDKARPWGGIYLADDEGNFAVLGFIPVSELKQLVETARAMQLAQIKSDNGTFEIQAGPTTLFARQKGDWATVSQSKEALDQAPADPLKLLGEMSKNYDLAVRLLVKNTPSQYREQLLALIRAGVEAGTSQMPDESDEQFELRISAARQGVEQLTAMINELDNVMLGWKVDPSANTTHLDLELTARSGTKLVDQFAMMKPGKSKFAGFMMPQAAVSANWVGTMSDADVARAKTNLALMHKKMVSNLEDQGLSADETKLAAKLLDDIKNFVEKTIESKKSDGGMTLLLDPRSATLVAGGAVAEGGALEKIVEQLVANIQETDPDGAKMIKLNADNHRGVRFHTFTMPTPKPELKPFVGDKLEIVLGIAADRVYLAAGRDAAKTLKSVMDESKTAEGKETPPAKFSISAGTIAKFIAAVEKTPNADSRIGMFLAALADAGDKDHVLITASPIERGVRMRLELEEGLVKALATMGNKMSPMGGAMPGGMPPGGPVPPQ